jgi:hypothetical protein
MNNPTYPVETQRGQHANSPSQHGLTQTAQHLNSPGQPSVSQCAYQLWLDSGQPSGRDTEFWLEAEREIKSRKDRR